MLAVIRTGGKQYLVSPGQKIKIDPPASLQKEKIEGKEIIFDEVLLLEKNKKIETGTPLVKGAKVIGKITSYGKGEKVTIFKYKAKKRYKVKKGHRQPFIEVEITKISQLSN